MNIVHIATEFAPFAKVGGLADVISSLSLELQKKSYQVKVILPKYPWIKKELFQSWKKEENGVVTCEKDQWHNSEVFLASYHKLKIVFIDMHHPDGYFSREKIYGYEDDTKRFLYFSKVSMDYLSNLNEPIDVLHLHDWHTSSMALFYKAIFKSHHLKIKKIVLTVHNFEYQGNCEKKELLEIGLQESFLKNHLNDKQEVNLLKIGIILCDSITTVSPTYAKEILDPPNAFGLEKVLKKRKKDLFGILNALNTSSWDPAKDSLIKARFSAFLSKERILKAKKENKHHLLKQLQMEKKNCCLIAFIGRLVPQKGTALISKIIPHLLKKQVQFILCGSSSNKKEQKMFAKLKSRYKNNRNIHFHFEYDEALSRQIYAGADFLLIPSLFEPCGLIQLIAMRYGSIPIVRKTGGLADTVFDLQDESISSEKKSGFVFEDFDLASLKKALNRAIDFFDEKKTFHVMQKNLKRDFSWENSIKIYEKIYRKKPLGLTKRFFHKIFVR